MAKRKVSLKAIEGAIKSANTPAPLKKGLIKKYGKQLGLTQAQVNKYMKLTKAAKKVAKKVKAKKNSASSGKHARRSRTQKQRAERDFLERYEARKSAYQYIVTAMDRNKGYRATISKPMSKAQADKFKKDLEADMKMAAPQYKWASAIKIEKAKKSNTGKHAPKSKAAKLKRCVKKVKRKGGVKSAYAVCKTATGNSPVKITKKNEHLVPDNYVAIPSNTASRQYGWWPKAVIAEAEKQGVQLYYAGSLKGRGSIFAPQSLITNVQISRRANPPRSSGTLIYNRITAIEAEKGNGSLWPGEPFRHDFKKGGRILGLANGDLLIKKGGDGKKLWGNFNYDKSDGSRKNPVRRIRKRKPSFGSQDKMNYAVQIDSLDSNEFYKAPWGRQLSDLKKIEEFKKTAKKGYVGAKHKSTIKSVREWIKLYEPTEFYAKWKKDSPYYKDDSVEIWYKGSPRTKSNKPSKRSNVQKHYVGIKRNKATYCALKNPPTKASHGKRFTRMHGPFTSKKAAEQFAAKY